MATTSATKAGSVRSPAPGLDIFKTPENSTFYSANQYRILDKSKQEIRLIELSTQTGGDGVLECKLLPATLLTDIRKQYLALSYCAGDPTNIKEIMVNGVKCNVFANLHYALVLARHYWIQSSEQGPLRLWVDQLCINQHDLKERSHQVGFMRDIYQSAERTLACLSTIETTGRGLEWLIDLCQVFFSYQGGSDGQFDTEYDRLESERREWVFVRDYLWHNMHNETFVDGWIAFYDVLSSPWWNRAWICQEFLVSGQVTFMFGKYFISWEQCYRVMYIFCGTHSHLITNRERFLELQYCSVGSAQDLQLCRILDIVNQRDLNRQVDHVCSGLKMKINWTGSMDIKDLLLHSRSCKSSDDRDRVYAILGLASPGYDIVPDYSNNLSASEVMMLTTRKIIEKEDSLDILVTAAISVQCRNLDVPSWVVDWSSTETSDTEFEYMQMYSQSFIPHESPRCAFETITNTKDQTLTHILWVYGIFVAKVRLLGAGSSSVAFASDQGWYGAALISVMDGDEAWFLRGSRVPMVLRPRLGGYQVISPTFLMKGSQMPKKEDWAHRRHIKLY